MNNIDRRCACGAGVVPGTLFCFVCNPDYPAGARQKYFSTMKEIKPMNYQITEQANGKFSVYTDRGAEVSMTDEELLGHDLTETDADALIDAMTKTAPQ